MLNTNEFEAQNTSVQWNGFENEFGIAVQKLPKILPFVCYNGVIVGKI